MSSKAPWQPLSDFQEFPSFATQADAAKVNAPGALDYISTQDEKNWYDPNADQPGDGKTLFLIDTAPWVIYPRAFFGKLNPDQTGIVSNLAIPVVQAKKVNIKPTGTGMTNVPGTGLNVPVPLIPLAPTQVILRQNPFGPFQVRNTDVPDTAVATTAADTGEVLGAIGSLKAMVQKIMDKFGIS